MVKLNLAGIGMTSQRTRERLIGRLQAQGIQSRDVLEVIRTTPRHVFLDEALSHRAYEDVALPIGYNQTISQPFIVAKMTEAVLPPADEKGANGASEWRDGPPERLRKVLEIGSGCGYQSAVIAQLAKEVYSVERIKPLLDKARKNMRLLGLHNVSFKHDDGSLGWKENGPFDAIIVAAAPQQVPQELLQQLAEGGRLIIPVGDEAQELRLIQRGRGEARHKFESTIIATVRFVPMYIGQLQS